MKSIRKIPKIKDLCLSGVQNTANIPVIKSDDIVIYYSHGNYNGEFLTGILEVAKDNNGNVIRQYQLVQICGSGARTDARGGSMNFNYQLAQDMYSRYYMYNTENQILIPVEIMSIDPETKVSTWKRRPLDNTMI